jgi:FtsX-like permease family protein
VTSSTWHVARCTSHVAQNYESGVTLHVRATQGDPLTLLPGVRAVVRSVDPAVVVARPQRLRNLFDQSIASQRMMATLVGLFSGTALRLAAVGLHGVMAHLAGQRRTEIGIRLALGARPRSILSMILGEGLRLVALGAVIGLGAAFATSRSVESQLFGVRPTDPLTFCRRLPSASRIRHRRVLHPRPASHARRSGRGAEEYVGTGPGAVDEDDPGIGRPRLNPF